MLHELHFQPLAYAVRSLQMVLANKHLDAFVLEVIVHDTLV